VSQPGDAVTGDRTRADRNESSRSNGTIAKAVESFCDPSVGADEEKTAEGGVEEDLVRVLEWANDRAAGLGEQEREAFARRLSLPTRTGRLVRAESCLLPITDPHRRSLMQLLQQDTTANIVHDAVLPLTHLLGPCGRPDQYMAGLHLKSFRPARDSVHLHPLACVLNERLLEKGLSLRVDVMATPGWNVSGPPRMWQVSLVRHALPANPLPGRTRVDEAGAE
jgi:hypothetical protein